MRSPILAVMQFTDPLAFEEFLAPVGGKVQIRPMVGNRFRANIDIRMLPRVGLFKIEADSFSAQKAPQQDFYGFTVPLNVPFTVSESGYDQTFAGSNAHMLSPGRPFNLQCKKKCLFLVCNFYADALGAYKERMLQETATGHTLLEPGAIQNSYRLSHQRQIFYCVVIKHISDHSQTFPASISQLTCQD